MNPLNKGTLHNASLTFIFSKKIDHKMNISKAKDYIEWSVFLLRGTLGGGENISNIHWSPWKN